MEDAEIDRLRKEICRSFGSSPHKKKYWLALLEMHVAAEKLEHPRGGMAARKSAVLGSFVITGLR
jgi:hypothetical protein